MLDAITFAALLLMGASAIMSHPAPAMPVTAVTPDSIHWELVPGTNDGRERALIVGRPEAGGRWTYRLRVPNPIRVEPHTHPVDEYITILEGRWSLGIGRTFRADQLTTYPAGSFVVIPAGAPHFIEVDTPGTVIQSSGTGPFATHPLR